VTEAQSMEDVDRGELRLLSPAEAVAHLPTQSIDDLDARRLAHGQTIAARVDGERAALRHGEELVAVGVREGDAWRPKVVMRDA